MILKIFIDFRRLFKKGEQGTLGCRTLECRIF